MSSRTGEESVSTQHMRRLIQLYIDIEGRVLCADFVNNLETRDVVLTDWECMTDLLLGQSLSDRHVSVLIKIMSCCVKRAATGEHFVLRHPRRKLSAQEEKTVKADKVKLTNYFVHCLPKLLKKFIADPDKLVDLFAIIDHYDVAVYTNYRPTSSRGYVFKIMKEIVMRHTTIEVLNACSKAYRVLSPDEFTQSSRQLTRALITVDVVNEYRAALDDYKACYLAKKSIDEGQRSTLVSTLNRVSAFYLHHNLCLMVSWDELFFWVNQSIPHDVLDFGLVNPAIASCHYALMWELATQHTMQQQQVAALRTKMFHFVYDCNTILKGSNDLLAQEAFITICDLLIVFKDQLEDNTPMMSLVLDLKVSFVRFVRLSVFAEYDDDEEQDEQTRAANLPQRRNCLASFCKLIIIGVFNADVASEVFKHYVDCSKDYADIIKETLAKTFKINKINCAQILVQSLTDLFEGLPRQFGTNVNRKSQGFMSIKKLAKQFAQSFGSDKVGNRDAVASLHEKGIRFSVDPWGAPDEPPANIAFLELLCEFTKLLIARDKRIVLQYFESQVPKDAFSHHGEHWQLLFMYHDSLEA